MFLLFNAKNTQIVNPYFTGKFGGGPILGLWQKCYATYVTRPYFINNVGTGIYYSFTCDNTVIADLYAENTGAAISGSNVSDFGQFGTNYVYNLQIQNPTIVGGPNSVQSTGITIGSVHNLTISNADISAYQIGINIIARGAGLYPSQNIEIINPKIRNCNQSNDYPVLHAGIDIDGRYAKYVNITGGAIYDDQITHTQQYPISIGGGPLTLTRITNCRLSATLSGTIIGTHDGGSVSPSVTVVGTMS